MISLLESSLWTDRFKRSTTSFNSSLKYDGWWKSGSGVSQPDFSPYSVSSTTLYDSFNSVFQSVLTHILFVKYLSLNENCSNVFWSELIYLLSSNSLSATLLTQAVCNWCLSVLNLMFATLTRSPVSNVFLNISGFKLDRANFSVPFQTFLFARKQRE